MSYAVFSMCYVQFIVTSLVASLRACHAALGTEGNNNGTRRGPKGNATYQILTPPPLPSSSPSQGTRPQALVRRPGARPRALSPWPRLLPSSPPHSPNGTKKTARKKLCASFTSPPWYIICRMGSKSGQAWPGLARPGEEGEAANPIHKTMVL